MLLLIVCHKVGNQIQLQHVLVIGRCVVANNLQKLIDTVTSRPVLLMSVTVCMLKENTEMLNVKAS